MTDFRPAILATNSLLVALSSAAIACRVGRRVFLVRSFSWHDALITLAAISASLFSILQMVSTRFGLGLPNAQVPDGNMGIILKLSMASLLFYFTCNWAVKHSLLLFYATLTIDRYPRLSINIMHAIAFAFGTTCILVTLFQCHPMRKMWDGPEDTDTPGHCINMNDFNYFNSCFMLATDLVLYAMPLAFTWRLHVSRPQRIAVNVLFALGGLVLAASGTRIYFVHEQDTRPDFTYRFAMTMMCAVIENHLAIIVACAPSIKVILLHLFPSLESRFEKLVSKGSGSQEDSEFSIATIGVIDVDMGMCSEAGKLGVMGRPASMRTTTGESGKSERRNARKWWKAPSSWEVNKEEGEGGGGMLEDKGSIAR
ncbi:hypothetical protein BDU57DRAFT_464082 [Ampelomyces quisqualis]|uniref:Rhodopsin domain-containing protein n=1 Tax=Ampelomyces quisqualis TaxID=50730 RepID=A0A6A5R1N4_AMPQU|nr:hypothetical protein BDU57DRAFT_464082 [Ampelomyces quisqualis]